MDLNPSLFDGITQVAKMLPESLAPQLKALLHKLNHSSPSQWEYILAATITAPPLRTKLLALAQLWHHQYPQLTPESLYLSILTAHHVHRELQQQYEVKPIWTLPNKVGAWPRSTETTILDLIAQTHQELLIICFAVYKIPQVVEALAQALDRGVKIRLIVELPDTAQKISFGIFQTFPAELLEQLDLYYWPKHQRTANSDQKLGSLHIKAIVSDRHQLLVSSANLTDYALKLNLELGLFTHQPKLAEQIITTVETLIAKNFFLPIPPDYCSRN